MKRREIKKTISVAMAVAMTGALLAGCGNSAETASAEGTAEVSVEEAVAEVSTEAAAAEASTEASTETYFKKGVYANYSKDLENPTKHYFYVFSDDSYGYTEDADAEGMGLPFDTKTEEGKVLFSFGGADEKAETLVVTGVESGKVYGYFEGASDREMVFELLADADPANFNSLNYVGNPEESVYTDANGWSVKYDATKFAVNQGGSFTTFVYTGECAGTNMITATYTADNKAEAAIKELAKSYGDKTECFEGTFPGKDQIPGYCCSLPVDAEGSGAYMTAFGRDYMDGALIFQIDGHMGNDEDNNMTVYDAIAAVMDSIEFN